MEAKKKAKIVKPKKEASKEKKPEQKNIDMTNIDERINEINKNKGFVIAISINPQENRTDTALSIKGITINDVLAEIEKFKIAFMFGAQKNAQQQAHQQSQQQGQMQAQKPKEEEPLSYAH
ncbi:MAG: hypothetical protein AB1467_04195 [Candidatus Diapherotrites archaeon]